ncbi:hypothetical protein JXC34_02045 [Candidatus Woesearchaeota archaeon]|nr:hypothetical protein [Candidatus Woesearchaeota archaeon]
MHILNRIIILFCLGIFVSCKAQGSITPEQAFYSLQKAYNRSDAADIVELLSEKSKNKIREMIIMIGRMQESQQEALAERFEISPGKLKSLTPEEYIEIQILAGKKIGSDFIGEPVKHKITRIDNDGNKAVVCVENGMELVFVKEGPYWKFEMSE